ncbi:MAG: hypothetical protein ACRDZR_07170 [Acidimicrobiales bacterium]
MDGILGTHRVRARQCPLRTFMLGMLLTCADHRPAHLSRVHEALVSLPLFDRRRLGVEANWHGIPHQLTYRQVEYLNALVETAIGKDEPDGLASASLQRFVDALIEASVPTTARRASTSLAVDWTDYESFAHPPGRDGISADPEAAWGHRRGGGPGEKSELFFGHYCSLATMVRDEDGPKTPELVSHMTLSACSHDPVPVFARDLVQAAADGRLHLGDVLCDSGYAHRVPEHFALPLRRAGAALVIDLHPQDRGPQGTHGGAICHNGNLYCPAAPKRLFELSPLARDASAEQVVAHDERAAELARYKLGRLSADDADGYHRVMCPAALGKVRCPLRESSMMLDLTRPEVISPPEDPPTCCTQRTVTVPPSVNAKTAQKHDYPSRPWRRSFARRTGVERSNSRVKDPATIDIGKGWCRLMGLVGPTLFLAAALAIRNLAVADAFDARQEENQRRAAAGRPARTRRRRRTTLSDLVSASP